MKRGDLGGGGLLVTRRGLGFRALNDQNLGHSCAIAHHFPERIYTAIRDSVGGD